MKLRDVSSIIEDHKEKLARLLISSTHTIQDVAFSLHTKFDIGGVYVISTPNDKEIVYAGRTKTKSVVGRIRDHRSINTSSDLKGMVRINPSYPQGIDSYRVRCIEIIDPRERLFFEHFVIGVLKPTFNK